MYGYIYKTTNLLNGKIYIGQHKWSSDSIDCNYFGSGKLIVEAINTYGIENFKCEILCWCKTEKELEEKEIFYIDKLKSTTDYDNYNISDGGYVPRFSGPRNGNYGRHWNLTEEQKENISRSQKGHRPYFTGHHSEESKKKIGEKTRLNNLNRDKSIYLKSAQTARGNKMMNKDGLCKRVHPEDFDKYLKDGWVFGGLSRKGKYKNRKQRKSKNCTTKDLIAINNRELNNLFLKLN